MDQFNIELAEAQVRQEFQEERVKVHFSSISLRADKVYVSRAQALRSMDYLQNLIDQRKAANAL